MDYSAYGNKSFSLRWEIKGLRLFESGRKYAEFLMEAWNIFVEIGNKKIEEYNSEWAQLGNTEYGSEYEQFFESKMKPILDEVCLNLAICLGLNRYPEFDSYLDSMAINPNNCTVTVFGHMTTRR